MPTALQLRRGTTSQNNSFTGSVGEVSVDTTLDTLRVHDGSTAGGFEVTTNTATQTLTNKTITSPTVSGLTLSDSSVVFEGSTADSFETTLTASDPDADRTVTIPNATTTLVGRDTTDTLTNKTLTTPVIAEIDSGSTITLDATTDIVLDADGANITMKDGGATVLDFVLNGSTSVTLDAPGDIILDADGGDFKFQDGGTEILRVTNSSSDVIIRPVVDAKDLILQQRDGTEVARVEDNGTFNIVTDKLAINGTAVTATAAELNLLDGGTSVGSSITLADADGFVVNDGGTMKTIPASDIKTYNPGGTAWQSVVTGNTTMVAGRGYFVNTTSAAITMTLPSSASQGDTIQIIDYAGTADTNNITIGRNSHKIQGDAADLTVSTERAAFSLVYVDATQGWLLDSK